jgi:xanthine/uracil permease
MPVLIGRAVGLPTETIAFLVFITVLTSALTTLIQVYKFGCVGSGMVLFMGSSGAYWGVSQAALTMGGIPLLMSMNMLSALVEVAAARFLVPLRRIFTPVTGGVVLMLIPVAILPAIMGSYFSELAESAKQSQNLIVFAATSLLILGYYFFARPKFRTMIVFAGVAAGLILSSLFGMVDWSQFLQATWIGLPEWQFHLPTFSFSMAHLALLAGFIIATISSTIETVGDAMLADSVSCRKFTKTDFSKVSGALYADGVGNILAGLLGGLSNTTYSGNISLLKVTRVASRRVGGGAAILILFLGLSPKAAALFLLIPNAVLIPITIFMFAMLFQSGLSLAGRSQDRISQIIVGISFLIGLMGQQQLLFNDRLPEFLNQIVSNGITIGGISALLLTMISNAVVRGKVEVITELDKTNAGYLLDTIEQDMQQKYALAERDLYRLRLCAEELFTFMCDQKEGAGRTVRFALYRSSRDDLVCEVTVGAKLADADVVPDDCEPGEQLDLILLNKLASRVEHVRSGGNDYISFELHPEE